MGLAGHSGESDIKRDSIQTKNENIMISEVEIKETMTGETAKCRV